MALLLLEIPNLDSLFANTRSIKSKTKVTENRIGRTKSRIKVKRIPL